MSEEFSDPQLTGDDPMLGQIEALASQGQGEHPESGKGVQPAPDPLEPGEPELARFEPDASQ